MTTSIQKWGNSQELKISKFLLEALKWQEGEQLEMILCPEKAKRKSIQELFADYHDDCQPAGMNWGEPEGEEVW